MKLYHGSNMAVQKTQILASDRKLDLGTGFYLTSSLEQAERWAEHTTQRRGNGIPTVSIYEILDSYMNELNVKIFHEANEEWLLFVVANRKGSFIDNNFDMIIGPVANNQTIPTITLFEGGFLDVEAAIRNLKPQKLKDQYVIKTEKALQLLQFKEAKKYE